MDTLSLYLVTWNVATRSPSQDLNSLLDFPSQYDLRKPLPDFYVIGLQEVKSQPQNILLDSIFTDPWTLALNRILCSQNYVTVKTIRLQGLILVVYTQMKHVTHLRDIEAEYTKTGLGGVWGNKGAVSIRFNMYGMSVCFVNCHLTPHEPYLADRVADYNTIVRTHTYRVKETSNILYHDYVFWIGDLNFRTDHPSGNAPTAQEIVAALEKVEKDQYGNLMRHDQLRAVMQSGDAFSEFSEADINFPPTYKFNIGTDTYDIKRKPSWTDRILYKVIANNYEGVTLRAELVFYHNVPHYTLSDHKPVVAKYNIKLRPNNFLYQERLRQRRSARPVAVRSAPIVMSAVIGNHVADASVAAGPPVTMSAPTEPLAVHGPPVAMRRAVFEPPADVAVEADEALGLVEEGDEDQGQPSYTEASVEFAKINNIWYIGDADFRTQVTLSPDVRVNPNDWIGIYDANFQSLDDYISYEYLARVSVPGGGEASPGPRTITLSFPVGSGVRTPGFYRFIYFSQPNSDVRSVLGISDPFEVSSKEDRAVAVEPHTIDTRPAHPSSPSHLLADFATLDVANLSRHFSNDLNID